MISVGFHSNASSSVELFLFTLDLCVEHVLLERDAALRRCLVEGRDRGETRCTLAREVRLMSLLLVRGVACPLDLNALGAAEYFLEPHIWR